MTQPLNGNNRICWGEWPMVNVFNMNNSIIISSAHPKHSLIAVVFEKCIVHFQFLAILKGLCVKSTDGFDEGQSCSLLTPCVLAFFRSTLDSTTAAHMHTHGHTCTHAGMHIHSSCF